MHLYVQQPNGGKKYVCSPEASEVQIKSAALYEEHNYCIVQAYLAAVSTKQR